MAKNINEDRLKEQSDSLVESLEYYNKFAKPVVDSYISELDKKVAEIENYTSRCRQLNLEYDVISLQRACTELSSTIYFVSDKYEQLSMMADMANVKYKDKYNEAYIGYQGSAKQADRKYTVDQLRALANQDASEEELIHFMYDHAAAIIKGRIDAAQEHLRILSKCLSAQIESMKRLGS